MNANRDITTHCQRISHRFPDAATLGRTVGFDVNFRQLDGGEPSVPAVALLGENVSVMHMRFSCRFHQLATPPAGKLTVGVPVSGLTNWFGRAYRSMGILPFNHESGIDGVSEKGFEAMTVSISGQYLDSIASSYRIPVPVWLRRPEPDSIIERNLFNLHFRKLLTRAVSQPEFQLRPELEDEITIALLKAAHRSGSLEDRSSPRVRNRAIKRALDYIADHQDGAVSVREICRENNIALRTLNRAFNERFGIGPKAYLKRRRLSAVRSELLNRPAETLVSDIANRWGFWHLGQFAKDYRSLFGELPSQTNSRQNRFADG